LYAALVVAQTALNVGRHTGFVFMMSVLENFRHIIFDQNKNRRFLKQVSCNLRWSFSLL
jgi:hypothetical protein